MAIVVDVLVGKTMDNLPIVTVVDVKKDFYAVDRVEVINVKVDVRLVFKGEVVEKTENLVY